jgi:hypothetical protein
MLSRWQGMRPALAKARKQGGRARRSAVVYVIPVTNKQGRKRQEGGVAILKSSRLVATVILTMLAAAVVLALPVTAAPQQFVIVGADLTRVPGPGDPNGNGSAEFHVYKARVCYTLIVNNIKPATAAHIHRGVKGHTGPIVVPTDHHSSLNPPRPGSGGSSSGASSGCEAIPPALSMKLRQNSQRYYVNVHNKPYPHGAIRGQLLLGH